jgi:hypothetical protein
LIDWSILRSDGPVDIAGNFARGFQLASGIMDRIHERNALAAVAAQPDNPSALASLYAVNPTAAAGFEARAEAHRTEAAAEAERQRRASLGQLYTQDPAAAQSAALGAGDFDLAKTFQGLDADAQKHAATFWENAGPVAYHLKQLKDPGARQALWNEAKPILASMGVDNAQLDRFDPLNDAQLDAAIATAQKIGDLVSQSKPEEFNVEPGAARYQRDPVTGKITTIIAPNPGPAPMGAPANTAPGSVPAPAQSGVAATLTAAGLPQHVVSGFLGNFHVEGGYGGAAGDGGASRGIAQWNGDRATNFERVIGKPVSQATPDEQAKFVVWEMHNPEAAGMTVQQRDAILNARTPGEAASLIDQYYERSSGVHRAKRVAAAEQIGGSSGGIHVVNQAEFASLPSGAQFIALGDPNHTVRVKP